MVHIILTHNFAVFLNTMLPGTPSTIIGNALRLINDASQAAVLLLCVEQHLCCCKAC